MDTLSLNTELPGPGQSPAWVELIPAGPQIIGRDGRRWLNDRPQTIVDTFVLEKTPIPLDWEHSTEVAAPKGQPAPAAGWIEELAERIGGSIWGRVNWTTRGAEMVTNREYRYLSPAFQYDKKTNRIYRLVSAGLTNRPNLDLVALNRSMSASAPFVPKVPTLTPEELAMCSVFGHSPEELLAEKTRDSTEEAAVVSLTQDELAMCAAFGSSPEEYARGKAGMLMETAPNRAAAGLEAAAVDMGRRFFGNSAEDLLKYGAP